LLLRHSLQLEAEAQTIEAAVDEAIAEGCRTTDLGGSLSTTNMANEIIRRIEAP
jgi:3-isopropylmalate dehydrogenase